MFDREAAALEATIDQTSVGGVVVGPPAPQLIATFKAQSLAVQRHAALRAARGYLARIRVNVEGAPG